MDYAIILASGIGIDGEELRSHGKEVFGSLPQIKRLIITAQRAGIKRFTIIAENAGFPLKKLLEGDKRIESEVAWCSSISEVALKQKPFLILQSNLVITPEALSSFIDSEVKEEELLVLVDISKDAWIKATQEGDIVDVFSTGGRAVGAFIASGKLLGESIRDFGSINLLVQELAGRERLTYKGFSGTYWMRLSSDGDSVKRAEDLIFAHVGKTATGWISRSINSKFSLPTSRLLVKSPLTPNMISVGINVIGAFSGAFYAIGHPVIGAICLQIATILDRCDGEVARVKLMETKKGQWVDTISDQVTVLSFLIGAPLGYYLVTESPIPIILGSINIGIFMFFVIWSFYFLSRYTSSGSLVTYFEIDRLIDDKKTTHIRKLIKLLRPMGRRNFYSLALLVLAIFGGYPWVVGATTVTLTLFLIHQLEDILKLRRVDPDSSVLK